ncbi:hypothetical protein [Microbacterium sp.]|uniref:hypothetical protein n=1 Tax=Microbacterium sp. TaxID=51671 RepID=UPI0039E437E3
MNNAQRAAQLYREGVTRLELTIRFGVSERTMQRWLRKELDSGEYRASRPLAPEARARAVVLCRDGVPDGWVAEDVGADPATIRKIRREEGIPPTPEWKIVAQQIRHNSILAGYHADLRPRGRTH